MLQGSTNAIGKILSPNDVGDTGSKQVGIYIPKDSRILNFFPSLDTSAINPGSLIKFTWDIDNTEYLFRFVYYNGKIHGMSTRNEFRLTRMTEFFRKSGLRAGDMLVLYRDNGNYYISDRPPFGGIVPIDQDWIVVK